MRLSEHGFDRGPRNRITFRKRYKIYIKAFIANKIRIIDFLRFFSIIRDVITWYCRDSSVVEQGFCKPQVGGSNPFPGSQERTVCAEKRIHWLSGFVTAYHWTILKGRYPSGQRGQTVNLLAKAFGGSNPSLPMRNRPAEID